MNLYVVAPRARADLDAIWEYIAARASAEIATNFIRKLRDTFRTIASSPRAGIDMPDLPPGGVRKFPMGNYLVYYRSHPGKIVISRVLHGKRAQTKAFRRKPKV